MYFMFHKTWALYRGGCDKYIEEDLWEDDHCNLLISRLPSRFDPGRHPRISRLRAARIMSSNRLLNEVAGVILRRTASFRPQYTPRFTNIAQWEDETQNMAHANIKSNSDVLIPYMASPAQHRPFLAGTSSRTAVRNDSRYSETSRKVIYDEWNGYQKNI